MARPALTSSELTAVQDRLLTEAARIIATGGYSAFSMRRLAASIGMTAGALYRYFPTKQHVLNAYWATALRELHERLVAIDESVMSPPEAIRATLIEYGRFGLRDRDRFRLMFLENDQGRMDEFGQQPETLASYFLLRDRVARAIESNSFRPIDPDTATRVLWGAVHGVLTLIITVKELQFDSPAALVDEAIDVALRGLANHRKV